MVRADRLVSRSIDRLTALGIGSRHLAVRGLVDACRFRRENHSTTPLERLADVLVAEIEEQDRPLPKAGEALPNIKYAVGRDALETARLQLSLYALSSPSAADALSLGHCQIQAARSGACCSSSSSQEAWQKPHLPRFVRRFSTPLSAMKTTMTTEAIDATGHLPCWRAPSSWVAVALGCLRISSPPIARAPSI